MVPYHVIVTLAFLVLGTFEIAAVSEVNECESEAKACKAANKDRLNTCSTCLQKNACCSWCQEQNYLGDRCGTLADLKGQNCPTDKILIGGASSVSPIEDKDLSNTDGNQEAVQIKPQKIYLRVRQGDAINFSFKYRAAKDYPIQLYYLMDMTNSMKAHKEKLVSIGKDLGDLLQNLTKHYQLAFGYYADKVAMPFYKMTPADVENPCGMLYGETCSKGFAFVHAQDFTADIDTFVAKVANSNFTSNLDDLENGLEPIMQILQCGRHITWLKETRKMIIMATNSLLHMAGDGILAGVTKKQPGGCLLDAHGVLDDYLAYDYPSLEEVRRALEMKKVQLVLTGAGTSGPENHGPVYEDYYRQIHNLTRDVSVFVNAGEITDNIRNAYEQVTKKIQFSTDDVPNYLAVTYTSSCNDTNATSAYCLDTNAGTEYHFNVSVLVSEVPDRKQDTILISESNIDESLRVHVEYIVNEACDCANMVRSDCNGHGSFNCGQCECDPTWYDANCSRQCTADDCRFKNESYTSRTCSSKGECDFDTCKCVCDDDASGDYCHERNCEKDSLGRICSGRGLCQDGECLCDRGYSGNICDCSASLRNCYKDNGEGADNATVCGGHGECICNRCACNEGAETFFDPETQESKTNILIYFGEYCQYCKNCGHTCSKYLPCVTANVENGTKEAYCDPSFPPQIEDATRDYGEESCSGQYFNVHDQRCSVSFMLTYHTIFYKSNGCPTVQAASVFIIVPLALILICGLLALMVWKGIVTRKDKMEYAKFKKEQESSGFQVQSPLYKDPITTFKNPMHSDNRAPQNSFSE